MRAYRRHVLRAAILLVWVGVMAVLYRRVAPIAADDPVLSSDLAAEATESWHGIYRENAKIGWAQRRRVPTDTGFALESRGVLKLRMLGVPRVVQTRVTAETDRRLRLKNFRFRIRSGTLSFEAEGKTDDRVLEVTLERGQPPMRIALTGPIVLPETLHEILAAETLETGRTYRYAMFDPLGGPPAAVELSVGNRTSIELGDTKHDAWEIMQRFRGSEFRLWISPDGEVLREEGPLGLVLVREDEATARTSGFGGEPLDIVEAAAIPVTTEIPNPRNVQRLRIRVSGVPDDRPLDFPPRQTAVGPSVEIRREAADGLPVLPILGLAGTDPALRAGLAASPLVQSDDGRIRETAREIVGEETNAVPAARKLLDWVFTTVTKVPMASVPSARAVLESRQGDCNEHAVLYAALARASGLPARIVAGTVYMPAAEAGRSGFYYHAWVEVWLGQWVAVDPTFGQFPADATHLKLLDGDPETHSALLALIGRLGIVVEEFG